MALGISSTGSLILTQTLRFTAMSMCIVKTAYRRPRRSTLTIGKCLQRRVQVRTGSSIANKALSQRSGSLATKERTSTRTTDAGGWDTNPDIYVGVLKQNVFIEASYTAYTSVSNYIQTINKDIRFAADLLSKAAI